MTLEEMRAARPELDDHTLLAALDLYEREQKIPQNLDYRRESGLRAVVGDTSGGEDGYVDSYSPDDAQTRNYAIDTTGRRRRGKRQAQLSDMSDEDREFFNSLDSRVEQPADEPSARRDRTWGEAAKDTGAQLATGVNQVFGAIPNLIDPSSDTSQFFNDNAKYWQDKQSDPLKLKVADATKRISEAAKNGLWDEFSTAVAEYSTDPALAAKLIAEVLPSMIPAIGVAKAAQAITIARGASAAIAARAGVAAGAAVNSPLNAGGARQNAYEDIYNEVVKNGGTPEEAKAAAMSGSLPAAGVGAVTGLASGATGIERAILSRGVAREAADLGIKGFTKRAGAEMLGEQAEEVLPQITTNAVIADSINKDRSLTSGVGTTAAQTLIGAGPGSAVAGYAGGGTDESALRNDATPVPETATDEQVVGEDNRVKVEMPWFREHAKDRIAEIESEAAVLDDSGTAVGMAPEARSELKKLKAALVDDTFAKKVAEQQGYSVIEPGDPGQAQAHVPIGSPVPSLPVDDESLRNLILPMADGDRADMMIGMPRADQNRIYATLPNGKSGGAAMLLKNAVEKRTAALTDELSQLDDAHLEIRARNDQNPFVSQTAAKMLLQRQAAGPQQQQQATAVPKMSKFSEALLKTNNDVDFAGLSDLTPEGNDGTLLKSQVEGYIRGKREDAAVAKKQVRLDQLRKDGKLVNDHFSVVSAEELADTDKSVEYAMNGKKFRGTRIGKDSFERIKRVAGFFNREVVLVRDERPTPDSYNDGFVYDNADDRRVFLNVDAISAGHLVILGHELSHHLEKTLGGALYKKLSDAIDPHLNTNAEAYQRDQGYGGETKDKLFKEIRADLMGNRFGKQEFWEKVFQRIEGKEPGLAKRVKDTVVSWLRTTANKLAITRQYANSEKELISQLRGAVTAVDEAYVKAVGDFIKSENGVKVRGVPPGKAPAPQTNGVQESKGARLADLAKEHPGLRRVAAGLSKPEKLSVTNRTAKRVIEMFDALPSADEIAVVAYAGKAKRGWYKNSADALTHVFGDEARRFAGLLAAMSPQVSVEVNARNALRMWMNWTAAGRPTDRAKIVKIMGASVEGSGTEKSVLGAWTNNSVSALTIPMDQLGDLTLSGPKVNSFMLNLTHNWEEVTNDAWMANYYLIDQKTSFGGRTKGPGYIAASAKARIAAAKLTKETGVTWTPAEIQETVWSWAKTFLETLDGKTETRTAEQLLADNAIHDDVIAATPDFELLFKQQPYAGILEDAGYGDKLATMPQSEYADPGKPPFSDEKRVSLLSQAARRIEFLQRQRRTPTQISWESKPGAGTGILPGIFDAPLSQQEEYLSAIYAAIDAAGLDKKIGIDMRQTLFGPSAWEGDVAAGAQTVLQKTAVTGVGGKTVEVSKKMRDKINLFANVLGYVLNQKGVYWHYPIYKGGAEERGVEVNFGRRLTHQEVREIYDAIHAVSGRWDFAPAITTNGFRVLNFSDFGDNPVEHRAFHGLIKKALNKLPAWADGHKARTFSMDGDAIENDYEENPNGEGYLARLRESGRPDLLKWVDGELRPAIERVNGEFARRYGWGAASLDERNAADTGATPDNFNWRPDAGRDRRDRGVPPIGGGEVQRSALREYGEATDGSVSVTGVHYSGAPRTVLESGRYGSGLRGAERNRVMAAADTRLRNRIHFYVDAGRGIRPEQGVGNVAHAVRLNNIYDANRDTAVQRTVDRSLTGNDWSNAFESAVIDAGHDGYVFDFGTQRAVVLIGDHSVPVAPSVQRSALRYAPRQEGETDKAYAKRAIDTLPEPAELPEEHDRYFDMTVPGATVVPMSSLISSKTEEDNAKGGSNAPKRFRAAYDGILTKRGPIEVFDNGNGTYTIKDGNGTYTGMKRYGWKELPVQIIDKHRTAYVGWDVSNANRNELLRRVPPKHEEFRGGHITIAHGDRANVTAAPEVTRAEVIGEANNEKIQALIVRINGKEHAPDGRIYHITWSKEPGIASSESNEAIADGWTRWSKDKFITLNLTEPFRFNPDDMKALRLEPHQVIGVELNSEVAQFIAANPLPKESIPLPARTMAERKLTPMMAEAHRRMVPYSAKIRRVAEDVGGLAMVAPVKGMKRAAEKMYLSYSEDINEKTPEHGGLPGGARTWHPEMMNDLLRSTIVVGSANEVPPAIAAVSDAFGGRVVKTKDRFAKPTAEGYSDVLMVVRVSDTLNAEVQINTPEMLAAKGAGHELYAISRNPAVSSETYELAVDLQRRVYGKAAKAGYSPGVSSNTARDDLSTVSATSSLNSSNDRLNRSAPGPRGVGDTTPLPVTTAVDSQPRPLGRLTQTNGLPSDSKNSALAGKSDRLNMGETSLIGDAQIVGEDQTAVSPVQQSTMREDITEQAVWLEQKASEEGYASVDDLLMNNTRRFFELAGQWREQHPEEFDEEPMTQASVLRWMSEEQRQWGDSGIIPATKMAKYANAIGGVVDAIRNGERLDGETVPISPVPPVLRMLNVPSQWITASMNIAHKLFADEATTQHDDPRAGKHREDFEGMTTADVMTMFSDPLMVIRSGRDGNQYEVIANKMGAKGPIMFAVTLDVAPVRGSSARMTVISSGYSLTPGQIVGKMVGGSVIYAKSVAEVHEMYGDAASLNAAYNRGEERSWSKENPGVSPGKSRPQLPLAAKNQLTKQIVRSRDDVVEWAKQRSTAVSRSVLRDSAADAVMDFAVPTSVGRAVRDNLSDAIRGSDGFNFLHRTIATQMHKARINPEFGKVFDLGQKLLDHTAMFAMRAQEKAPSILPDLGKMTLRHAMPWNWGEMSGLKEAENNSLGQLLAEGTLFNGPNPHTGKVFTDAELRAKGMSDSEIDHYREARAAIDQSIDDSAKALLISFARQAGINAEDLDAYAEIPTSLRDTHRHIIADLQSLGKNKAIKDANKVLWEAESLKNHGYAPLMRFGEHTVRVTDANGDVAWFSMHETLADAKRTQAKVSHLGTVETGKLNPIEYQMFGSITPGVIESFANHIPLNSAAEKEAMQDYLRLTTSHRSAMQRMMKREGIAGFSSDATRVLAHYVTSAARQNSKLINDTRLNTAVSAVKDGDIRKEAQLLSQYLREPQEGAAKIRGFLFFNFLGGSIAAGMVNMTQPVLMTYPYLAQYGVGRAGAAMSAGMSATKQWMSSRTVSDPVLRAAMQKAHDQGIISPQEIFQMMAAAETGTSSILGHKFMRLWGMNFAITEAFNRALTFSAAYRIGTDLAASKGLTGTAATEDAYAFSVRAVEDTQGLYNKGNRPNWARESGALGVAGTLAFTFKQYSIAYVEFLKRLWDNGTVGKRSFAIAIGMLWLAAGANGLPGADDLDDIIETALAWLGYPKNMKRVKKQFLMDTFGMSADAADTVLVGVSKFLPLDIQARLGVGNIVPGTSLLNPTKKASVSEMTEPFGPIGGVMANAFKSAQGAARGDVRGAVMPMLPKAIGDLAKGLEMASTGEIRDNAGRLISKADGVDAFVKSIGFQPEDFAIRSRAMRELRNDIDTVRYVQDTYNGMMARSIVEKDSALRDKAQLFIKEWNASNPELRVKSDMATILNRAKQMQLPQIERFVKATPAAQRAMVRETLNGM